MTVYAYIFTALENVCLFSCTKVRISLNITVNVAIELNEKQVKIVRKCQSYFSIFTAVKIIRFHFSPASAMFAVSSSLRNTV